MIYSMARCEYHSSVIKDIDMLLSELFCCERFNANEGLEHKLNAIFFS